MSLHSLRSSLNSSLSSPRRGTRALTQAVLKSRSSPGYAYSSSKPPRTANFTERRSRKDPVWGSRERFGESARPMPMWKVKSEPHFADHLNALFQPLQFNLEVARRCLTHGSHPTSINGHNAGMSFMGRRVLESYLLLFLHSSKNLKSTHDFDFITKWTLNTYTLGQYVGSNWGLGRVMRWVPAVGKETLTETGERDGMLQSVGLYKFQGEAVAAVVGAIYEQFGASVAQRAFHTRLLPHLLLDGKHGGLPLTFHEEALAISERMGGPEGDLTKPLEAEPGVVQ